MTVSTSTARAGPYAGSGTTGPFAVPFRFLADADLRVIRTVDGVDTDLTISTDYTVSGAGGASGSVTLVAPLAVGQQLTILRNVPLTQEADYVPNDPFPAESHETALDKLTMISQQLAEQLTRTLQLPASSTADASSINVAAVEVVAGIADDVSTVASAAADIGVAADNIVAIQGAAGNAAAAAASAVAADASADAAAASAALITLPLAVAQGGTGATDAETARTNLGVQSVIAGTVILYATNTAPTGYLKANGALVSRTTYATLFSVIGTTFGAGDGSTTFALPDLRGEFVRGWDDGRGVDSGRVFGSAQGDAVIEHVHLAGVANAALGPDASQRPAATTINGSGVATTGVRNASNTAFIGATETRPRNIALLACIKI